MNQKYLEIISPQSETQFMKITFEVKENNKISIT